MYIIDMHCDSIGLAPPLVTAHNFSKKYPQLQVVALFDTDGTKTESYINTYKKCVADEKLFAVTAFSEIENAFLCGKNAVLLSVEGGSVTDIEKLYNIGVRIFGLAWYSNSLAKSNRLSSGEEDTGVTDFGKSVIQKGNALGMLFDVSHLSDNSFWDVAALSKKPIVATHSNFRALCSHSRNLTDGMAREIISQGGMICLNLYPDFVGDTRGKQTVGMLFEHIDYCLSLGGEDCLGFGFDIDGTGGKYISPLNENGSIHDSVTELMLQHNYPQGLIRKIAYKNCLDFFEKNL